MPRTPNEYSAGIVFYCYKDGQVRMLLGREQFSPDWSGSLRWSDFGGRSNLSDNQSPATTANREMFEETLGIFGDLSATLASRRYIFRVTLRRGRTSFPRYVYLVEVPWDDEIVKRFHGRREHLKNILYAVARIRDLQRSLRSIRAPAPDYLAEIGGRRAQVIGLRGVEQRDDDTCWVHLRCITVQHVSGATSTALTTPTIPTIPPLVGKRRAGSPPPTNIDSIGKLSPRTFSPPPANPLAHSRRKKSSIRDEYVATNDTWEYKVRVPLQSFEIYQKMLLLHNWLRELCGNFPQDVLAKALSYSYIGNQRYWLPYVRKEFLEKDEIRMWSLAELQDIVDHPNARPWRMRLSFIPALKVLLQQMKVPSNGKWR